MWDSIIDDRTCKVILGESTGLWHTVTHRMKRTRHYIGGGHGILEDGRKGMTDALITYLNALAHLNEQAEMCNHAQSTEFFGKQYDGAVEFASQELGFDIRIEGSK